MRELLPPSRAVAKLRQVNAATGWAEHVVMADLKTQLLEVNGLRMHVATEGAGHLWCASRSPVTALCAASQTGWLSSVFRNLCNVFMAAGRDSRRLGHPMREDRLVSKLEG